MSYSLKVLTPSGALLLKSGVEFMCLPGQAGEIGVLPSHSHMVSQLTAGEMTVNCNDTDDYFFISKEEFLRRVNNDEFVEWEEVYKGVFYGTLFSELENAKEKNLIFDIDVVGGLNIKRKFKEQSLTIFIKPPSLDELEKRLKNRNSETDSNIKIRIDKAKDEILLADKFDYVVENDILEKSYKEVFKLVNNFIHE